MPSRTPSGHSLDEPLTPDPAVFQYEVLSLLFGVESMQLINHRLYLALEQDSNLNLQA